jgi:hypothetical protein
MVESIKKMAVSNETATILKDISNYLATEPARVVKFRDIVCEPAVTGTRV